MHNIELLYKTRIELESQLAFQFISSKNYKTAFLQHSFRSWNLLFFQQLFLFTQCRCYFCSSDITVTPFNHHVLTLYIKTDKQHSMCAKFLQNVEIYSLCLLPSPGKVLQKNSLISNLPLQNKGSDRATSLSYIILFTTLPYLLEKKLYREIVHCIWQCVFFMCCASRK